jgi:hypothetical protein
MIDAELNRIALGKILRSSAGDEARFNASYDSLDIEPITALAVRGDYNNDSKVDGADYVVWRHNLGGTQLMNETKSLGMVDQADYDEWRENFGFGTGSGSGALGRTSVPEPAAGVLLALAAGVFSARWRRASAIPGKRLYDTAT